MIEKLNIKDETIPMAFFNLTLKINEILEELNKREPNNYNGESPMDYINPNGKEA